MRRNFHAIHNTPAPPLPLLLAAYAAIYIIWGSTYLAIRFSVETIPPFLGGGVRFLAAGGLLSLFAFTRTSERPTRQGWKQAFKVGGLMLVGGYGGVMWAEQVVPSGLTALIITVEPLWFVLFDWLIFKSGRPGKIESLGLLLGFVGTIALVLSEGGVTSAASGDGGMLLGMAVILGSTVCWTLGSLYSRKARIATSDFLGTAMEMLAGGVLLSVIGLLAGEGLQARLEAITAKSLWALLYLVIFGSLVAFTAFLWLMKVEKASRVATHTFVNPLVALFLGWLLAEESITGTMLIAAGVIILSVVLITTARTHKASPQDAEVVAAPLAAVSSEEGNAAG
jgi:drug/metabolite transporter (DMT)-like permease